MKFWSKSSGRPRFLMKPSTSLRGSGLSSRVALGGWVFEVGQQRLCPVLHQLVELTVQSIQHRVAGAARGFRA